MLTVILICLTEELIMFNQFVFSPEEQLSITQETLFKPEKPFL